MKFSDGFWLMRAGVHASHPAEVLDATAGPGSLVVYATTRRIRRRGDLLTGPAVTLSCTGDHPDPGRRPAARAAGVHRVPHRAGHQGGRG